MPSDFFEKDEVLTHQRKDTRALWNLFMYGRPYFFYFFQAVFFLGLAALLQVTSAQYIGKLAEAWLKKASETSLYQIGANILLLEFLTVTCSYIGRRRLAVGSSFSLKRIREILFHKLQLLPMSYYDRQPLGRLVTRLTHDVEGIEDFFSSSLGRLLQISISMSIVLVAMFFAQARWALYILLATIPAIIATYLFRNPIRLWNQEYTRRNSAINAQLSEFISGISVIRSFAAEDWSKNTFDEVVMHHFEAAKKLNLLNALSRPIIMALCMLPLLLLFTLGTQAVSTSN